MHRNKASELLRDELNKNGLQEWGIRLSTNINDPFLGLCDHQNQIIILNAHHIDIHPDLEIIDTIKHEVAHALTCGHGHDDVWASKARELGCTNTLPCSHLNLPERVIDGVRSGATIEMTVEEETHIIRRPTYKVTRLQDKCPECGKVAKEKFSNEFKDKDGNIVKLITLECFHIIKKVIPKPTAFDTIVSNDWKPEIKHCLHDWGGKWNGFQFPKNQCAKCEQFKLYDFQVKGAHFTESALAIQKGAGIFDDMGLGKTVQALAILRFHADKYTPALIITKSAIKFQWLKQIMIWNGPQMMGQIISTGKDHIFPGLKTYIVPYDLLRRLPSDKIKSLGIKLVILDECQQIKNPDSTRTQEVRKIIGGDCKILPLSGTPWKNHGSEFFPALNMIDPIKFYSYQHFLDTWVDYYYHGNKRKMAGIKNIDKFKEYTNALIIRREFNEVMEEFPEINRTKLPVQLNELEQATYNESVQEFASWYNEYVLEGREEQASGIEILAKMARMRHIVGLAKIPATLAYIEQFVEDTDRKLVIFVHHKDVGELMYGALKGHSPEWVELSKQLVFEGIKVLKYTSELNDRERFIMQEEFNNSKRAVMIASTLACGEGVNLQTCSDYILHERQWNPMNEDQAGPGRFRRIGQKSSVINGIYVEAEGSIDESLDVINARKGRQFHEVMNKGEMPKWNEGDMAHELANAIMTKFKSKKRKSA